MVRPKVSRAGLICRTEQHYHHTASDCQTPSGQIPGDEPKQRIDGYGGKDFKKMDVLTFTTCTVFFGHHVYIYKLRQDRLLTQKPNSTVDSDFIIRMLFKDSY